MDNLNDIPTVAHAIQQAVAPVFLLTGIGSILSVLTNRLGRAIDRFRKLGEQGECQQGSNQAREMYTLWLRALWIRRAIGCRHSVSACRLHCCSSGSRCGWI